MCPKVRTLLHVNAIWNVKSITFTLGSEVNSRDHQSNVNRGCIWRVVKLPRMTYETSIAHWSKCACVLSNDNSLLEIIIDYDNNVHANTLPMTVFRRSSMCVTQFFAM